MGLAGGVEQALVLSSEFQAPAGDGEEKVAALGQLCALGNPRDAGNTAAFCTPLYFVEK